VANKKAWKIDRLPLRLYTLDMNNNKPNLKQLEDALRLKFNETMFKAGIVMKKHVLVIDGQTFTATEIHLIDTIGRHPNINVTELAKYQGVTKGAVSQKLNKLEKKHLIYKIHDRDNAKEIKLKLTELGMKAYELHDEHHKRQDGEIFDFLENASLENLKFLVEVMDRTNLVMDKYINSEAKEIYLNTKK
jgi:DNA-binding MarR family transcriptional regulator